MNPASISIPEIRLTTPDLAAIRSEDIEAEKQALPRRVAIAVNAGISPVEQGNWQTGINGSKSWVLKVSCEGALALSLCFDHFTLPEGAQLFIYDEARQYLLGAYTKANSRPHGLFATELLPGDHAIIEVNLAQGAVGLPSFSLTEISYVYRDFPFLRDDKGPSDPCEVNINCPEGTAWQKQKRGVARIYVKKTSSFFWCTGSLVNNTQKDLAPFFLTADHCAPDVSQSDLSQWIFYFNFEAPDCNNPVNTPMSNSLQGASKLASAGTSGSDFLLLRLDDEVPLNYGPFFNGWSIENISSPVGVTIHHPNGDIKKISTYAQPPVSSQWGSTPGTHWEVIWAATQTNWGVTEGGSSGSPLFDMNGRIIGTLTGGMAACEPDGSGPGTGPDKPDYYGKFSYSWDQNGSDAASRLKPWLDPGNTGITILAGMNSILTAEFEADERIILAGGHVSFTNLSSGIPDFWEWRFEGGTPASFTGPEPPAITYTNAGSFEVSLVVSDGENSDTLYYSDYIQVVGKIYPNPASAKVYIYLEEDLPATVKADVFNIAGQKVYSGEFPDQLSRVIELDISGLAAGIYTVRLQIKQRFVFAKVLKINK